MLTLSMLSAARVTLLCNRFSDICDKRMFNRYREWEMSDAFIKRKCGISQPKNGFDSGQQIIHERLCQLSMLIDRIFANLSNKW